jgi:hypothetical protein
MNLDSNNQNLKEGKIFFKKSQKKMKIKNKMKMKTILV